MVHVAGLAGAGKTTFSERLLDAQMALTLCVRGERDPTIAQEEESAPGTHSELRRYGQGVGLTNKEPYRIKNDGIGR
jgi:cytidylate kinase